MALVLVLLLASSELFLQRLIFFLQRLHGVLRPEAESHNATVVTRQTTLSCSAAPAAHPSNKTLRSLRTALRPNPLDEIAMQATLYQNNRTTVRFNSGLVACCRDAVPCELQPRQTRIPSSMRKACCYWRPSSTAFCCSRRRAFALRASSLRLPGGLDPALCPPDFVLFPDFFLGPIPPLMCTNVCAECEANAATDIDRSLDLRIRLGERSSQSQKSVPTPSAHPNIMRWRCER